jgi:hypothetical protein
MSASDAAMMEHRCLDLVGALRSIRWPQVRNTILFGLGAVTFTLLINFAPVVQFLHVMPPHLYLLGSVIDFQIKAFVLLVAIVVADRAVDDGAARRATYIAAAIGGCTLGVLLSEIFNWLWRTYVLPDLWPAHRPYLRGPASLVYFPVYGLMHWLLIGGSAVLLYAGRRAARQTEARLHAAELERIQQSKRALESRLQTMQARIEPQFLFNTLAQVEQLYETDAPLAGRLLTELIAYLRAAMPLMRSTTSTVRREIELVRKYVEILNVRLGNRLTFNISVPAGLSEVSLPPMMLLPLVDHALVHGLERRIASGTISVGVDVREGRLRLIIVDSGAGFVPDDAGEGIASIRERLEALYGYAARLDLHARSGGGTEAVMEIPCETDERRDDALAD